MTQHEITSAAGLTTLLSSATASRQLYVEKTRRSGGLGCGFEEIHESQYALINMDGPAHRKAKYAVVYALSKCSSRALSYSRELIDRTLGNRGFQPLELMRSLVVPSATALVAHLVAGGGMFQHELEKLLVAQYFAEDESISRVIFAEIIQLVDLLISDTETAADGMVPALVEIGLEPEFLRVNLMAFLTAGATNIAAISGSVIAEMFNSASGGNLVVDVSALLRRVPFQRQCFPRTLIGDLLLDGNLYKAQTDLTFNTDMADRELDSGAEGLTCASPVEMRTFKFGIGAHRCPAANVSHLFLSGLTSALLESMSAARTVDTKVHADDSIHRPTELIVALTDTPTK